MGVQRIATFVDTFTDPYVHSTALDTYFERFNVVMNTACPRFSHVASCYPSANSTTRSRLQRILGWAPEYESTWPRRCSSSLRNPATASRPSSRPFLTPFMSMSPYSKRILKNLRTTDPRGEKPMWLRRLQRAHPAGVRRPGLLNALSRRNNCSS